MGEQVANGDTFDPFGIAVPIIKTQYPLHTENALVQLQTSLFDQSENGDGSDRFGHTRDAEQVDRVYQLAVRFVRIAESCPINELASPSNCY